MTLDITPELKLAALVASLGALHDCLRNALTQAGEADDFIQHGECNASIGTLFGLEAMLDDAKALHHAILLFHRMKPAPEAPLPFGIFGLLPQERAVPERIHPLNAGRGSAKEEDQSSVNQLHAVPQRPPVATISDVLRLFPGLTEWHTGGGCFALRLDCEGGGYILVTECDDARLPPADATDVDVGRYAASGEDVEAQDAISVKEFPAWLDRAIECVREPKNVADYFVKKLRSGHPDLSLRNLPLDSQCGRECVGVIDAVATLIDHTGVAFGSDSHSRVRHLLTIASEVIEVYWRG